MDAHNNLIEQYKSIISNLPLNKNGWRIDKNINTEIFTDKDIDNIINCMADIKHIFKPTKQYNLNSYNGKHIIERYRIFKYISNGEFIAAMILSGYKYKQPQSLNLVFNASIKKKRVEPYKIKLIIS